MLARRLEAASSFANTLPLSLPVCLLITYNKGYRSLVFINTPLHRSARSPASAKVLGSTPTRVGLKTCTSRCVFGPVFSQIRLMCLCLHLESRPSGEKMSDQNLTGCVEKEAEKPPTSPGLTGCKPAADSKVYQQSAPLKSPHELKQTLRSSSDTSTHSLGWRILRKKLKISIFHFESLLFIKAWCTLQ